jgi:hypothetical protein
MTGVSARGEASDTIHVGTGIAQGDNHSALYAAVDFAVKVAAAGKQPPLRINAS